MLSLALLLAVDYYLYLLFSLSFYLLIQIMCVWVGVPDLVSGLVIRQNVFLSSLRTAGVGNVTAAANLVNSLISKVMVSLGWVCF